MLIRPRGQIEALVLVVVAVAGCNAVLGLEERPQRERRGGGGTSAQGGSTGAMGGILVPECEQTCVIEVPAGWSGPTATTRGATAESCGGDLPNVELTLHDGLTADGATCGCDCDDAVGVDCSMTPVLVDAYNNHSCGNVLSSVNVVLGACVEVSGASDSAHFTKATPDVSAASCAPVTLASTVPDIAWDTELIGCGPVELSSCAGQACFKPSDVPAPSQMCIYRAGDHDCPGGVFSERWLGYADVDDSRGCEPCGCSAVDVADCNEVVMSYQDNNCNNSPTTLPVAPLCADSPGMDSTMLVSVAPTGSCTPTGGTSMGDAAPSNPTTVCCVP